MNLKYITYISLILLQCCVYQGGSNQSSSNNHELHIQIELLVDSMSDKLSAKSIKKIAIMDYTGLSQGDINFGAYLSDEITLQLFLKEQFQIIERDQLDYIINEQKLNNSGLIDDQSAINIGKILSVDAVILGNISTLNNDILINTKAISAETGEILFINNLSVANNSQVQQIYITNIQSPDLNDSPIGSKADQFDKPKIKNYDQAIQKVSKSLLSCIKKRDTKCFSQFMASKDQFRKTLLIKYRNDKKDRREKIKNLNLEYRLYKKNYNKSFNNLIKRLASRDIDWKKLKIKKVDYKIVKNYDQKKLFRVDMIAYDKNKRIHIGFNAFKMNGNWIISKLDVKRNK